MSASRGSPAGNAKDTSDTDNPSCGSRQHRRHSDARSSGAATCSGRSEVSITRSAAVQRRGQQLLGGHAVRHPALRRQRVPPPRFGVAPQQRPPRRPRRTPAPAAAPGSRAAAPASPAPPAHRSRASAHRRRRRCGAAAPVGAVHQLLHAFQRRVVDRLVADVLQRAQDRRLAGPGESADQHHRGPRRVRRAHAAKAPQGWQMRPVARSSASSTRNGAEALAGSIRTSGTSSSGCRSGSGSRVPASS